MRYLRIPKERVGVLIGKNGETKQMIEQMASVKLEIDSEEGEISLDDSQATDPVLGLKAEDVIRAIGRGFSPEHALKIFEEEVEFFLFDIYEYVGKKENHVSRLKSRIIGRDGKTKHVMERLTGSYISIYGHTVGIIADLEFMDVTKKAIDMMLSGSKHFKVYRYIEREIKKIKTNDAMGF